MDREEEERFRVVVTGGSRGIGRACVESFARRGHAVLFTYRSSKEEADQLTASFERVQACHLDQGNFGSVQRFVDRVESWLAGQPLSFLINNAGLGGKTAEHYVGATGYDTSTSLGQARLRAEQDEALMRVNALGPLWVTQGLLPMLTAVGVSNAGSTSTTSNSCTGGARSVVLFVASVGGGSQSVYPGTRIADPMSKAALAHASKQLAAEHSRSPVDFLCISPGATVTDMFRASTLDGLGAEGTQRLLKALPKGRMLQPDDVAEAVWWLCTCPAARIFHGAVLDASQGLAVRPGAITEFS